jgi:hypothetical protein
MDFLDRFRGRGRPRLTGVSTPLAGVSWDWTSSERETLRRLFISMEGRRALWEPYILEVTPYVTDSVLHLREEFTAALQQLPERSDAAHELRLMRDACNKYLTLSQSFRKIAKRWLEPTGAGCT